MTKSETMLNGIQAGRSPANEVSAILQTMENLGIPENEITPRANLLPYGAWPALGRNVMKGQKSCAKVTVFKAFSSTKKNKAGEMETKSGKAPRGCSLFHISQTEETSEKPKK